MPAIHPTEAQLALYSGDDLGLWERWRVRRHLTQCGRCRQEIQAHRQGTEEIRSIAGEMPAQANWSRLSQEMTGNIRVGLAAGECIAGFEKTIRPRPRLIFHAAIVLAGVSAVALAAIWLNLPREETSRLVSTLGQVRWDRLGKTIHAPVFAPDAEILEASPSSIEVKSNGHTLSLMHPRSDGATVSINMQDSAGVQYVDADTGQVTQNRVYYAQ